MKTVCMIVLMAVGLSVMAPTTSHAAETKIVLETYADIALAGYSDSLTTAKTLKTAIEKLLAKPSAKTLTSARTAWIAARVPYQQTEVFRFGNKIVDDWEGRVNAWPLDEGLIDYVAGDYGTESDENVLYAANVIANKTLKIAGKTIDARTISADLLSKKLHEAEGIEANVAIGYHAVEFLLWGQDLNGTKAGAGKRPASDFDTKNCTARNCDRRAQYLRASIDLLLSDLSWMVKQWEAKGAARAALMTGDGSKGLTAIFTGMGSLSYGELAGERMKLGLLLHDPEEEHDCFSDNTHNSHYFDALGIQNVYLGRYKRIDGSIVKGPGLADLVSAKSPEADKRLKTALSATMARMTALVQRAKSTEAYDQMIGEDNAEGNAVVSAAISALIAQTKELERAIAALKLTPIQFEGSGSLGKTGTIKQ